MVPDYQPKQLENSACLSFLHLGTHFIQVPLITKGKPLANPVLSC